jgi:hypothetical protein
MVGMLEGLLRCQVGQTDIYVGFSFSQLWLVSRIACRLVVSGSVYVCECV